MSVCNFILCLIIDISKTMLTFWPMILTIVVRFLDVESECDYLHAHVEIDKSNSRKIDLKFDCSIKALKLLKN